MTVAGKYYSPFDVGIKCSLLCAGNKNLNESCIIKAIK
jgi:hypothetical protein